MKTLYNKSDHKDKYHQYTNYIENAVRMYQFRNVVCMLTLAAVLSAALYWILPILAVTEGPLDLIGRLMGKEGLSGITTASAAAKIPIIAAKQTKNTYIVTALVLFLSGACMCKIHTVIEKRFNCI